MPRDAAPPSSSTICAALPYARSSVIVPRCASTTLRMVPSAAPLPVRGGSPTNARLGASVAQSCLDVRTVGVEQRAVEDVRGELAEVDRFELELEVTAHDRCGVY